MKKLLPQANSIEKIVDTLIFVANYKDYSAKAHADFCKFDPRQSAYYLNAVFYLGFIDDNRNITDKGKKVLEDGKLKSKVIEAIFEDPLFNKIFSKYLFEGEKQAKSFGFLLLRECYPEYSEDVLKRRLSTLITWCRDIKRLIK